MSDRGDDSERESDSEREEDSEGEVESERGADSDGGRSDGGQSDGGQSDGGHSDGGQSNGGQSNGGQSNRGGSDRGEEQEEEDNFGCGTDSSMSDGGRDRIEDWREGVTGGAESRPVTPPAADERYELESDVDDVSDQEGGVALEDETYSSSESDARSDGNESSSSEGLVMGGRRR